MLRQLIAKKLRALASWLDGREVIDVEWHRANVRATNNYIGKVERYILSLEDYIQGDVGYLENPVEELRKRHHRTDTRSMVQAGWLEPIREMPKGSN